MTPAYPKSNGPIPTISRVCADGVLIEAVFDPKAMKTALVVCRPDSEPTIEDHVDLSTRERLIPYSPHNNLLASGCVLLPSDIARARGSKETEMSNTPKMRILRGGDSYGCSGGTCPTVYEAADGQIYVQGFLTTDDERDQVTLPEGEGLVRISRELWDSMSRG